MSLKRVILEMGHGNDMHGGDYTKAALRAVQDCIHHSSLPFLRTLGVEMHQLKIFCARLCHEVRPDPSCGHREIRAEIATACETAAPWLFRTPSLRGTVSSSAAASPPRQRSCTSAHSMSLAGDSELCAMTRIVREFVPRKCEMADCNDADLLERCARGECVASESIEWSVLTGVHPRTALALNFHG